MQKTKILFNIINTIFVILYIYPGSILGFLVYGEFNRQPQITNDFIYISSNHIYGFLALSFIGLIAYYKSKKLLIINYLILSSIILEVLHLVIPNRSFQFSDLFGNIVGVLVPIFILILFNFWKKNEFI